MNRQPEPRFRTELRDDGTGPGTGHTAGDVPPGVDLGLLFPIRRPFPRARWLIGLAILTVLLVGFWACGVFSSEPDPAGGTSWGPPLFFSVVIAYIVPIFGYICERTFTAINALTPLLDADAERIEAWRSRVRTKPRAWFIIVVLIGIASGTAHNLLLNGTPLALLEQAGRSVAAASVAVGVQLVWMVFTLVVAGLLDNALLLNRLARHARIRILDTSRLRPFATVAVLSTLALIGAQAAFPIMTLEGGIDPLAYIPGLLATSVPMVIIAALPVWPVHRRLMAQKRAILDDLNRRIGETPLPDPDATESLAAIAPLLTYRREVAQASEWPFDVGVMTRLALYLIIPPLTWVGAALIEHVVETFL